MKNKYKKKSNNPPHSNHRLKSIQKKVETQGYDSLSNDEVTFISNEIEKNVITTEDLQIWLLEYKEKM